LAQPVAKNYRFAEYFDPPNETHVKFLLEGATARVQQDGRTLLTEARIHNYRLSGESEMAVEAPQCTYDPTNHIINSAGPLRLQTADGKFLIEGEGFLWQQTNTSLTISNQVHTIIHPDLLAPPGEKGKTHSSAPSKGAEEPAGPPLEIFSHTFTYSTNSGLGVYRENVRVTGTNLSLSSQVLTALVPVGQRQVQNLKAEENVTLSYNDISATAEQAIYAADTGLARLLGHATWQAGLREGRGEEVLIDQTNKILQAKGNAYLQMPDQNRNQSGLLARNRDPATNAFTPTNQFITVESESYELRTNFSVFRQHVWARELAADQLRGQVRCELMRLEYATSNELQQMTAEQNVSIKQDENEFKAGKARYTATNGLLELTERPSWRAGPREGAGELVLADLQHDEMTVRGKAFMRLPSEAFARPSSAGAAQTATNTFADIFSDEYRVTKETARFMGDARLDHPQMKLSCPTIDVQFPPEGRKVSSIVAAPGVTFELNDGRGQLHGRGEKAVYTYEVLAGGTNDSIRLTGNPATLISTNGNVENKVIILDRANNQIITPGMYRIWGMISRAGGEKKAHD
jgi:lipopolysaccharide export system protein LptA